jgi:hypothetical protein
MVKLASNKAAVKNKVHGNNRYIGYLGNSGNNGNIGDENSHVCTEVFT